MSSTAIDRKLRTLVRQAVRYYLVAGIVAVGYLATYAALLALGVQYYLAIAVSQVITICWAFPLYRRFVFTWTGHLGRAFLRFLGVWSGGMIAALVITPILVEFARWAPFWAQLFTMVVVSLASFVLHRVFTFRSNATSHDDEEST